MDRKDPKQAAMAIKVSRLLKLLDETWKPHSGQVKAGQALFNSDSDLVYVECGRKFGKSELGVYCCWMYALTRPNAEVYYLAPAVKQARELVWANNRMQSCNAYTQDFIKGVEKILGGEVKIYNQEMRVVLPNGSFIKVDGSDNYNSQRGFKPDLVVADEYRDFKPQWIEAVRPNMAVKAGKMLFITTPPHSPNHAYEMAEECQRGMEDGDKHYYYLNLPSYWNDAIPNHHEWLAREQARLEREGKHNQWRREYMAEFITSSEHAVIPQLNRDILEPHEKVVQTVNDGRPDRMELYIGIDPSNSARLAVIISVYDPYTARLYILDCVNILDSRHTSASKAWPKVQQQLEMLREAIPALPKDVTIVNNPRTPWFSRDLFDLYKIPVGEASKDMKDLFYHISTIKDIAAAGQLVVSDRLKCLITEAELYQRSAVTKKIDQEPRPLINCLRYTLEACGYTVDLTPQKTTLPEDEIFLQNVQNVQNSTEFWEFDDFDDY